MDKKLRNQTEVIALAFYVAGLFVSAILKSPIGMILTPFSIPCCFVVDKYKK